jgi:lysine-specific demethylase 8
LPVPESLRHFACAALDDVTKLPSLTEFEAEFLLPCRPVVLRGLAFSWPAITRWSDASYLHSALGHRLVPVEIGKTYMDDNWGQRLMLFSEFYHDYVAAEDRAHRPPGYLAQTRLLEQVPQLLRDVVVPDYCCMAEEGAPAPELNVWFGPEGTVSPLHTDPRHNVFVQLAGSKVVLLFEATDTENLYPTPEGLTTNTSQVDAAAPDLERFPNFALATSGTVTVLRPGDALFIPRVSCFPLSLALYVCGGAVVRQMAG